MEMGWTRGVIALLTLGTFLGICWWAYRPGNKSRFEADALIPFAGEAGQTGDEPDGAKGAADRGFASNGGTPK